MRMTYIMYFYKYIIANNDMHLSHQLEPRIVNVYVDASSHFYQIYPFHWQIRLNIVSPLVHHAFQMRPRISIRRSVHRSVRPSIGLSVMLLSISIFVNISEQICHKGGRLGLLYASSNLYKMVYWSVSESIHSSVRHVSVKINENLRFLADQS